MKSLTSEFVLSGESLVWTEWVPGAAGFGNVIAVDTETSLIQGPADVPNLHVVSASDGQQHVVIRPEHVAEWFKQNVVTKTELIFHNAAFDFWVLDRYFAEAGDQQARDALWTAVDEQRVHDTMLLYLLVSLVRDQGSRCGASLAALSQKYLGIVLPKDRYRKGFESLEGQDWAAVDPGFFAYAATDAVVTYRLYHQLAQEATAICSQYRLPAEHGLLTEALQVKAAICLERVKQVGIDLDLEVVNEEVLNLQSRIDKYVKKLDMLTGAAEHGPILRPLGPKAPPGSRRSKNKKALQAYLETVVRESNLDVPRGKRGELTLSIKETWGAYRGRDPVIDAWIGYECSTKALSFFKRLQEPRIHPSYTTFVRSGRTSCGSPNIQQLPRDLRVREAIMPRPGHTLFAIDYTCLELRTLAAVCYERFGFSKLRDVLIAGIDPHRYTAAMFNDMPLERFNELPKHEIKRHRQHAKPFNFGVPGGMGSKTFVQTARAQYGVELTVEEAERFIAKLCNDIYPELGQYLRDDALDLMAKELGASPLRLRSYWPKPWQLTKVRNILSGKTRLSDGRRYSAADVGRVWDELEQVCEDADLQKAIQLRDVSETSPLRRLLGNHVSTTTGRVRSPVIYTQAHNTPFQGLAADGCKEVMWRLLRHGYRVIAFVHDEFLIELPERDDYGPVAADIYRICREGMQPFVPGIPVECEFAVTTRWLKAAEATYTQEGVLVPWSPPEARVA